MSSESKPDLIEAAVREIMCNVVALPPTESPLSLVQRINMVRDIIERHFAPALRAQEAMKLLESKKVVELFHTNHHLGAWRARKPEFGSPVVRADDPTSAVLGAAEGGKT